jgi:D-alanyl-D-alanine carboxypeptidase
MPTLRSLDRHFRPMAEAFFDQAHAQYPDLVVTSARRSYPEQLRLWQASQRGENDGLPAVPPGSSDHELGLAFDMARLNVQALHDPVLPELGYEWQRLGGRWWSGDPVHFAAPPGRWRPRQRGLHRRGRASHGLRRRRRRQLHRRVR